MRALIVFIIIILGCIVIAFFKVKATNIGQTAAGKYRYYVTVSPVRGEDITFMMSSGSEYNTAEDLLKSYKGYNRKKERLTVVDEDGIARTFSMDSIVSISMVKEGIELERKENEENNSNIIEFRNSSEHDSNEE